MKPNGTFLKRKEPITKNFFSLEQIPDIEIGIFGGAVRDWVLDKEPKDIDIVIKGTPKTYQCYDKFLQVYHFDKNKFDGNVIKIGSTLFDIWKLEDTYAIKNGRFNADWFDLVRSVPFNIDSVISILYNKTITFDFISGLSCKRIEFLNRDIRNPIKIAHRAERFAEKYNFELGSKVKAFVDKYKANLSEIEEFKENLMSSNE